MRKLLAALPLAALVVACNDQPTATNPAGRPDFLSVANLETRGYTLLWTAPATPEDQGWPGSFLSCINGGSGELTFGWGGPYEFWARIVETPSGRRMESGYIFISAGGAEYMRGTSSGDVWASAGQEFLTTLSWRYAPDGSNWYHQPFGITYTNQRGERIRIRGIWHLQTDAAGIPVVRNPRLFGEITQCQALR